MTDQRKTAAERAALREQRQQQGAAHGRRQAIETYLSSKCGWGNHADQDGGCANDGTSCLCVCHDPKDTP